MKKLWHKNYEVNSVVEKYCFGDQAILDNALVEADVVGSMAHALMLKKIAILSSSELLDLNKALREILVLYKLGKFKILPTDEDVHTKVENFLIEKCGNAGKKIHTGRSRNDQVLVDLRLYSKSELILVAQ